MTIRSLLEWGAKELAGSDSPQLDAELLLAHILKVDRVFLMTHDELPVKWSDELPYHWLVKKRKKHMPVAYILGKKEFFGLEFEVNRHVLIPRPDTEILVESVLTSIRPDDLLLDVGTGSGCIPIAILKNKPGLIAVATDISKKALKVAMKNARNHEVGDRIRFFWSDLLQDVTAEIFEDQDLIVTANLPYVPREYQVNPEAKFEPGLALYAEDNGLELYRRLLDQLVSLKPKAIFLECYEFQLAILAQYLKDYQLKWAKNMLGEARMLMLERMESI